jgi:hypothetical protein
MPRRYIMTEPAVQAFLTEQFLKGMLPTETPPLMLAEFGQAVHPDTIRTFRQKVMGRLRDQPPVEAPEPKPVKTQVQFYTWVIRKKEWPVKRLDQNGVPSGFVNISLAGGMVPA